MAGRTTPIPRVEGWTMDRAGLFHRLRAALRSCQLYPREGRARAEAIAGLHAALEGLLADRAAVRLAFLEDGVWIHGEPVPGGGKDDSLGPSIFGCGIREIHFLAGVERVELERFLEPLGRALLGSLNPLDEDLSLLLWEAELPHICYLLFEEPAEEPEVAPAAETSEGAYALEEYLDPDQDAGEGDVATALRPLGEAARLEILAKHRLAETEGSWKFGRLQIELLRSESSPETCAELAGHFRDYLNARLEAGAFHLLQRLWEALPVEAPAAPATEAFHRLRGWFSDPGVTRRALRPPFPAGDDLRSAVRLLESAPSAFVPDLLALAHAKDCAAPAELVAACLVSLARDPAALVRCLRDPRLPVRKAALEAEVTDIEGILALRALQGDPDPAWRRLVIRALGRSTRKERIPGLVQALGDLDATVRIEAAETLAARVGRPALEPLLQVMVSRGFEHRGDGEQAAIYRAAARAAPREVLPVLAEVAERSRFFLAARHRRRAIVAARVLAELGEEAHEYLVQRWGRKRRDLLRRVQLMRTGRDLRERRAA